MNKLKQLINTMPKEDLLKLKRDLIAGNLDKLINQRLQGNLSEKQCPVCGETIIGEPYLLEFGKQVRQKAHFDGADCLLYFIETRIKK